MTIHQRRDERGSASVFIVGMAITLVVVAGLVVDGGGALNERMTLADNVEAAAVAGAQATDELRYRRDGVLVVDEAAAEQRAREVLASHGYDVVQVSVSPDLESVTVRAEDTVQTKMLLLIGLDTFTISATATAEADPY